MDLHAIHTPQNAAWIIALLALAGGGCGASVATPGPVAGDAGSSAPEVRSADASIAEDCAAGRCPAAEWAHGISADQGIEAFAVAASGTGTIAVGGTLDGTISTATFAAPITGTGSAWVASYDARGTPRWMRRLGASRSDDAVSAVAFDASGNLVVAGRLSGAADIGAGVPVGAGWGMFVSSFSANGAYRWSRRFDGAMRTYASDLAVDRSGNVVAVGTFVGAVTFGDRVVDGGARGRGVALGLAPDGSLRWTLFADGAGASMSGVAIDAAGNAVITGTVSSPTTIGALHIETAEVDFFVASVAPDGTLRWVEAFGGTGWDVAGPVAVDAAGNAYVAGWFVSQHLQIGPDLLTNIDADSHVFVASFDALGHPRWARSFGSPRHNVPSGIATDAAGDVHVAGVFDREIAFGATTLDAMAPYADLFVATLAPDGSPRSARRYGGFGRHSSGGLATSGSSILLCGEFDRGMTLGATALHTGDMPAAFVAQLAP